MKYKIHREGLNIIFVLLFILLAFNVPAYLFIEYKPIPIVFMVISAILFLLVINFFRSPRRHYKGEVENMVLSSVDGTVVVDHPQPPLNGQVIIAEYVRPLQTEQ